MGDADRPMDPDATKRFVIPDAFLHALLPALGDGSTLLITDEPVLESTTGVNLAVLSSSPEDINQQRNNDADDDHRCNRDEDPAASALDTDIARQFAEPVQQPGGEL